jgi:hypothetical protein
MSIPAAHAWNTISISTADYGAVTWFYFNETGYITDSLHGCGTSHLSQCFTEQLNTNTTPGNMPNFYQAVLNVVPDGNGGWLWDGWIGCCDSGGGYTYLGGSSSGSADSMLNSTNNVFVMAINAGSSGNSYSITSCNYQFTQPAYSFEFFVLNLSTCTASHALTLEPTSSDFTNSQFSYMQSVAVGNGGGSNSVFKHTQITGELFDANEYTYTGSGTSLTAETSDMVFHDGTLGSVVPLCYHSSDASAPC